MLFQEGFNAVVHTCFIHIGIQGNEQNDCNSSDSCLGYGISSGIKVGYSYGGKVAGFGCPWPIGYTQDCRQFCFETVSR
jgi:hypothetical protein